MTVVLATVCEDGVVIGSDSQITDKGRGMTYPAEKLHPLGETAAWGGSGARSVLTDVKRCFNEKSAAILEAPDIGRALQAQVLPILRYHYETFIEDVPGEEDGGTPSAYVMAAGWRDGEPWIIEITPSGMIGHYADIGFHAIGSGAAMASRPVPSCRTSVWRNARCVSAAPRCCGSCKRSTSPPPASASRSACAGSTRKALTTSVTRKSRT